MNHRSVILLILLAISAMLILAGCSGASPENTLTVLAGSELKDLEPLFDEIRKGTGIQLVMEYTGTLDGAERLIAGEEVDLAWFSHAKYLTLLDQQSGRVKAGEKIMLSPVILGVKESKAKELGWFDNPGVTWQEVIEKAGKGELRYAMTNPASSNTGFTALIGVTSALAGSGDALTSEDVDSVSEDLSQFFKGQVLTSGSSGWLADRYLVEQDSLDGIINYESVLLSLNQSGELKEDLYLIYPEEGIVTADYPLMLINEQKREQYNTLVDFLRTPEFQQKIMEQTLRRPVSTQVGLSSVFPDKLLVEVPFPNNQEVIDYLLFAYLDEVRVPAHAFFVLDVSGSMRGDRLQDLKEAMIRLTGADPSLTGQFARFRNRERITMLPFSDEIQDIQQFEINTSDPNTMQDILQFVDSLEADGRTAIFSSLQGAYEMAIRARDADPERYYSIVLLSDGENTTGASEQSFMRYYENTPEAHHIKVFPILFGEADYDSMESIADNTGGRMFDAKSEALSVIFKEIRGYQ